MTGIDLHYRLLSRPTSLYRASPYFPKTRLKAAGFSTADINQIANLAFIGGRTNRKLFTKLPEDYLAELVRSRGEEALITHCIPTERRLWQLEAFHEFAEFRRRALAKAVNEFISPQAAGAKAQTIEQIIAAGENERVEFKASRGITVRAKRTRRSNNSVKVVASFGTVKTPACCHRRRR
jgi:hypothetical protein